MIEGVIYANPLIAIYGVVVFIMGTAIVLFEHFSKKNEESKS